MDCARCDYDNEEDARFCSNCGNKLTAEKKTCVACGTVLQPGEKICSGCTAKMVAKKEAVVMQAQKAQDRAQRLFFQAFPNLQHCPPVSVGHYYLGLIKGLLAGVLAFVFVSIGIAELFGGVKIATLIGALTGVFAVLRIEGHTLMARAAELGVAGNKPMVYLCAAGLLLLIFGGLLHYSFSLFGLVGLFGLGLAIGMQEERFD